jgi:hypothetical protein
MHITINAPSATEAIKQANSARLANPNAWLFMSVDVGGSQEPLLVKSWNTSIQAMTRNGVRFGSIWDAKVFDWKKAIEYALNY